GEVHVFSPDGKKVTHWKVNFHAHSINAGQDAAVLVAGDGRVAKFDKAGKLLGEIELPHIKKLLADKEAMRKQAEAQLKLQRDSFKESIKRFKEMKDKLDAIPAEKRTPLQKRQLQQYEAILKS